MVCISSQAQYIIRRGIYVVIFMFSPMQDNHLMKDDPTRSMINESEDEDETGAMLINRGSALSESEDLMAMTSVRGGSTSLLGGDDDSD